MTSPQAGPEGTSALEASRVTGTGRVRTRTVPQATVARLAVYLRMLGELVERGTETVSSDELAAVCGVNSAKLRKDLSYVGSHGIRGVGYEVGPLLRHLESALGLTHRQSVALVGIGNLGHALAGYGGFGGRGFPVTALFDVDPDLVGIKINGIVVDHVRDIPQTCRERDVTIGMIATPGPAENDRGAEDEYRQTCLERHMQSLVRTVRSTVTESHRKVAPTPCGRDYTGCRVHGHEGVAGAGG